MTFTKNKVPHERNITEMGFKLGNKFGEALL